jgi:hypothetical protein
VSDSFSTIYRSAPASHRVQENRCEYTALLSLHDLRFTVYEVQGFQRRNETMPVR